MKFKLLLFATLTIIVACAPHDKFPTDLDPTIKEKTFTVDGPSGYSTIYVPAEKDETPKVPSNIQFTFLPRKGNLSIYSMPPFYFEGPHIDGRQVLRIGCENTKEFQSSLIEYDSVEICGSISFNGKKLEIKANHVRLINATVSFESPKEGINEIPGQLYISTIALELEGKNSIVLTSKFNNDEFAGPPMMLLMLRHTEGTGTLNVISQSNIYTRRVK